MISGQVPAQCRVGRQQFHIPEEEAALQVEVVKVWSPDRDGAHAVRAVDPDAPQVIAGEAQLVRHPELVRAELLEAGGGGEHLVDGARIAVRRVVLNAEPLQRGEKNLEARLPDGKI